MTRTSVTLLVVAVFLCLAPPATVAGAAAGFDGGDVTPVDDCGTIAEPGHYTLNHSITGGGNDNFTFISQSCLVVESDDVVLDGRGHRISGTGVSDTTGIAIVGTSNDTLENVTIENVTVADWNQGLAVRHADNVTVRNVILANNAFGLSVQQSTHVYLTQSAVRGNLVGVFEDRETTETRLTKTTFEGNYAEDVVSGTDVSRIQTPDSVDNRSRLSAE